jgi:hypothetical protein
VSVGRFSDIAKEIGMRWIRPRLLLAVILGVAIAAGADPAAAQINLRASAHTTGAEGDHFSFRAALSADGRYVAFHSRAANLVTGDTNGEDDVFVHDLHAGVTVRVSLSSTNIQGDGDSRDPAISADGRYVTFRSNASNLVASDGNGTWDIFIRDRDADSDGIFDETGAVLTERVSVDSDGNEADGSSYSSSVSADGSHVAFDSAATNLAGVDPNVLDDVFVRDRVAGTTTRVSVDSSGNPADNGGDWPSISADGRWVLFDSLANNLVTGDTNLKSDVFVHDRQTGETVRVSVASDGTQGDDTSHLFDTHHAISGDGRFVVFSSSADNFAPDSDTNGTFDVFVHDRDLDADGIYDEAGAIATIHASVDSSGDGGSGQSEHANISDNGRVVVFDSSADDLVPGDTGQRDVFARDLVADIITRVSVDPAGAQADGSSTDPTVSGGGGTVAFHSGATNFVSNDTNGRDDIFARGPAVALCLDARGPDPELVVFLEPPGGCPETLGPSRDFIRGQVEDISVVLSIQLGPVRCADAGMSTTQQVLRQFDLDLAARAPRFYLTRLQGEPDFGHGALPGGATPPRTTGSIPCP